MLDIKNVVVVAVIFLNHNTDLCGQGISNSQLCFQLTPCTNFRARVTPFVC